MAANFLLKKDCCHLFLLLSLNLLYNRPLLR